MNDFEDGDDFDNDTEKAISDNEDDSPKRNEEAKRSNEN